MSTILATALTGNANTGVGLYTRAPNFPGDPAAVIITTTIGATPTVTVNIQGSIDTVTWANIPYALIATPTTFVTTALTITTAVTNIYILQPQSASNVYVFVRLALTANTNVTLTAWLLY